MMYLRPRHRVPMSIFMSTLVGVVFSHLLIGLFAVFVVSFPFF